MALTDLSGQAFQKTLKDRNFNANFLFLRLAGDPGIRLIQVKVHTYGIAARTERDTAEKYPAPAGVRPTIDGNKALMPYLGKTWTVSFMVPATGVSTDGQRSEMAATIGRLGTSNVAVGFYAVSNAQSGSIGVLAATDPGYAAAALAAARSAGLFFDVSRLAAAGRMRAVSCTGWDPGQAYGIVITVDGDPSTAVTTYQKPPAGAAYQPRLRAFALAGGRTAIGVEASEKVTSRDFADLVMTLPSNARLKSSV